MTLDELNTRWLVGPAQVDCVVVNVIGQPRFKRDGYSHSAMLGEYLQAYLDHLAIPWYRKGWDWKIVKSEMIRHLNGSVHVNFFSLK
jgi:hypothetical protein